MNYTRKHCAFLYEIENALSKNTDEVQDKDLLIESINPVFFINQRSSYKVENMTMGIKLMENVSENIWNLMDLYAQFNGENSQSSRTSNK